MSRAKPKVLILGGAGFIGCGIARFVSEHRTYEVTIVDDFSGGTRDPEFEQLAKAADARVVAADLSQPSAYDAISDQYDYVYVLASVVGVNRCIEEPDQVIRINTGIIANTAEWMRRTRPGRVLFASSSENYAATTELFHYPIPTGEEVPLSIEDTRHPRFTYAVTKILGESAFFAYGQRLNIPVTVVRYQNIYGPRMGFKHAIPHIIERFHGGEEPFRVYGAEQTRAFAYIDDAAEGTVLALEDAASDQEVYHIGNDDEITIEQLTRQIGDLMGYGGAYEPGPTYPGSVSRRCPDVSKASERLGYTAKVSLDEGLRRTVAWYHAFFDSGEAVTSGGFRSPEALHFIDTDTSQ